MNFETNKEKIFELGKSFDEGLVNFDRLSVEDKYNLTKYYALKNEQLDTQISTVKASLVSIDNELDSIYNDLVKYNNNLE